MSEGVTEPTPVSQTLTVFLNRATERGRRTGRKAHVCSATVSGPSCARNPQQLQAVIDLGLMLSTTAEMTAPAAFAPSTRACST